MMDAMDRLERQLVKALRDHLETEQRPRLPAAGVPIWNAFLQIDRGRAASGVGPNPLSHAEIEAWARLNRCPLQPHHVRVIRALDDALLDRFKEKSKGAPEGMGSLPQRPAHKLSPRLFDAAIG